ncbi:DNA-binding transcriptional repressor ExuR [Cedecea neteri]|uniref:DNA-binding transcriptional repressor ExuR n=1 Tax=Cedecea neteri TaxID=158822 RepID=A0A2X2V7P8_9ENTR|nr:DNA-binding transcriptional repressor ExuR [Cedecea neteri]
MILSGISSFTSRLRCRRKTARWRPSSKKCGSHRIYNPYWKKLHEHIDMRPVDNWCDDHDQILKALIRKDPHAAKLAMWQHLENTRQMLFNATSDDFEFNADRYFFAENPVIHLDTAANGQK